MNRTFRNPETGKTWSIQYTGKNIFTSSNGGKPKETTFETIGEAQKKYEKDMWAKLKKGFIFTDATARKGQPSLHRFIAGGYTGAMPISQHYDNHFLISHITDQIEITEVMCISVSEDGRITPVKTLPDMVYDQIYSPVCDTLFMNIGHQIVGLNMKTNDLIPCSQKPKQPVSTLDIFDKWGVWYDEPNLVVYDLAKKVILFQKKVVCGGYGGHSHICCGAIHNNKLAYCVNPKEIILIDIMTEQETVIKKYEAARTAKMCFSSDGKILFTQEQYGSWKLLSYQVEDWRSGQWQTEETVTYFATDSDKGLVATVSPRHYPEVTIYDDRSREKLFHFTLENAVKNAYVTFTKDKIAAYTDRGCVSLYQLF